MSSIKLPRISPTLKTGSESFRTGSDALPFTLLDYWSWSGSDLISNTSRGVLAEFLVARALGINDPRVEWDAIDLVTRSGAKIEVKNSAYIQAWGQNDFYNPVFDIAPKTGWNAADDTVFTTAQRSADLYVFCLQAHKDQATIDPLDVNQWEFYVLHTDVLNKKCPEQKTISLNPLLALNPQRPKYADLGACVEDTFAGKNKKLH